MAYHFFFVSLLDFADGLLVYVDEEAAPMSVWNDRIQNTCNEVTLYDTLCVSKYFCLTFDKAKDF